MLLFMIQNIDGRPSEFYFNKLIFWLIHSFHINHLCLQISSKTATWSSSNAIGNGYLLDRICNATQGCLPPTNTGQKPGVSCLIFIKYSPSKSFNFLSKTMSIYSFFIFSFMQYYSIDVFCFFIFLFMIVKFVIKRYFMKPTQSPAKLKVQ